MTITRNNAKEVSAKKSAVSYSSAADDCGHNSLCAEVSVLFESSQKIYMLLQNFRDKLKILNICIR